MAQSEKSKAEARRLQTEIHDLEGKVNDARRLALAAPVCDRSHSDLRMLEQELLALQQRLEHAPHRAVLLPPGESPSDRMERKLDSALSDSFPGSDAVSFLEPTPHGPAGSR